MSNSTLHAQRMSEIANLLENELQDKAFALIVVDESKELGDLKYISNASRKDMIKALKALLDKWEQATPETN